MAIEIRVPQIETNASIGRWFKRVGNPVTANEPLAEIETDVGTLEVAAQVTGVLSDILVPDGRSVETGTVLGNITTYIGTRSTTGARQS